MIAKNIPVNLEAKGGQGMEQVKLTSIEDLYSSRREAMVAQSSSDAIRINDPTSNNKFAEAIEEKRSNGSIDIVTRNKVLKTLNLIKRFIKREGYIYGESHTQKVLNSNPNETSSQCIFLFVRCLKVIIYLKKENISY